MYDDDDDALLSGRNQIDDAYGVAVAVTRVVEVDRVDEEEEEEEDDDEELKRATGRKKIPCK